MATGKRAGARRAKPARPAPQVNTRILGLAAGITLCVVAWGYLVYAAIDFGGAGRSGSAGGWAMLALASAGAMACLFVGLMLASRLAAALGFSKSSEAVTAEETPTEVDEPPAAPKPPRTPGGRRAAR